MDCIDNADCLDWLPSVQSGSVDLIIIDPPYSISKATGYHRGGAAAFNNKHSDFGAWDWGDHSETLRLSIRESYRILRNGGTIICFYDLWKISDLARMMTKAKFVQNRMLCWLKPNPAPINSSSNYLTNAKEFAISAVKVGKPTFNSSYDNGVYRYAITRADKIHPTQKPLSLISDLVCKHSDEGAMVVDFFSGGGTTALAALSNNRRFMGCEKDAAYCAASNKRISDTRGLLRWQ